MAFDGLFTIAMTKELQQLVSGRISKIHQPNSLEIVMHIRASGSNHKVLFSIHPSYARVQLTGETIENPSEPPMFCMFLRKHLEGGFISSIRQLGTDRVIVFEVLSKNEIGDDIRRELHMEIMGRHSNLLLVDPDREIILDSLKHLPPSVNSYRTILPGQKYIAPPPQDKLNPIEAKDDQLTAILNSAQEPKEIVQSISGFSPLHANELLFRMKEDNPLSVYRHYMKEFQWEASPEYVEDEKGKVHFSASALTHLSGTKTRYASLGELLDRVFFARAERDRVKQQAGDLERWLQNEIDKLKLKMKKLQRDREQAEQLDQYQLYGELLMANLHAFKKGAKEAEVVNYYSEIGETIRIPLDVRKTPVENAQKYYSRYNKAKTALKMTEEQLAKTVEDIEYFEMLQQQVNQASPSDIEEIREELAELGFMKARTLKKKKKDTKPVPEKYVSSTGLPISVGKNNKQNDYLTFKIAARTDTWLHTKDIPGSHVVIHHPDPDEETILEAAHLSAYFSKARESSSVPVDYTLIRHVKKPNGSKPGFVIYFEQQTVYVTPDEELVRRLRK
ncbi:NFACT family protein [Chungangia koreensis]|uniref:Rqc2 homolog RqcH n=1 Tax=Chungangia koreensis TaxID=752657 RepID=A0ABV8X2Q8_9LACT